MANTVDQSRLIEPRNLAMLLTLASTGLYMEIFRLLTQDQILRRQGGYVVSTWGKNTKTYGPKQAQLLLGHKHIATTLDNHMLEEAQMGITHHLF